MSLAPIERKLKFSSIKTGTHLVEIADMLYLRNAAGEAIKNAQGHPTIVVVFRKSKEELMEKHYVVDGGQSQKRFNNMLRVAQVKMDAGIPKKKDIIGKKLYVCVQEVHYVNDDQVVLEDDGSGQARIEYHIFRIYPDVYLGKAPRVKGDPAMNPDGIPGDEFVTYVNISENPKPPAPKVDTTVLDRRDPIGEVKPDNNEDEMPTF